MVTSACDAHSILISETVPTNASAGTTQIDGQDLIVLYWNAVPAAGSVRADGLAQPIAKSLRYSRKYEKPRFHRYRVRRILTPGDYTSSGIPTWTSWNRSTGTGPLEPVQARNALHSNSIRPPCLAREKLFRMFLLPIAATRLTRQSS